MKPVDKIYSVDREEKDFRFDSEVVEVFDDMIHRSVPFYDEVQRMITSIASDFTVNDSHVYDIGCSTGNTFVALADKITAKSVKLIGIDTSPEMVLKARKKTAKVKAGCSIEFIHSSVEDYPFDSRVSVFISCLTMQFIRPLKRVDVVKRLYDALLPGGCFIFFDKVMFEGDSLNRKFVQYYHDFKKSNSYTESEISRKRIALENVLIPFTIKENYNMLKSAGFGEVSTFFQWYNFAGFIAVKSP